MSQLSRIAARLSLFAFAFALIGGEILKSYGEVAARRW